MKLRCVYAIVHKPSGWAYVGSADDFAKRARRHRQDLRAGTHRSPNLQAAWTAGREIDFSIKMLAVVGVDERLRDAEQYWLTKFAPKIFNVNVSARRITSNATRRLYRAQHWTYSLTATRSGKMYR